MGLLLHIRLGIQWFQHVENNPSFSGIWARHFVLLEHEVKENPGQTMPACRFCTDKGHKRLEHKPPQVIHSQCSFICEVHQSHLSLSLKLSRHSPYATSWSLLTFVAKHLAISSVEINPPQRKLPRGLCTIPAVHVLSNLGTITVCHRCERYPS